MSNFTQRELNLMACIGECESVTANLVRIIRGTLCVRVFKIAENYSAFCTDEENNIQTECSDCCLDAAVKRAFAQYREKFSVVKQSVQFIVNAEDDMRKYAAQKEQP